MENRKTYKATPTLDAATSMKADNPFPMEYIEVSSVQSSSNKVYERFRGMMYIYYFIDALFG